MLRVWSVTAVTPIERVLETVRHYTWGFVEDYFVLVRVRSDNDRLKKEVGELKLRSQYLQAELSTADRARALSVFQAHSPSRTVAARIIGNGPGANSKVVFIDRGSGSGIQSGMAVITPDGIVGKVLDSYPTASLVMLLTDPTFAAGVISQKNRVHGQLKGQGNFTCLIDYVQNEEKVDVGEWFYTTGTDRIFPKGLPAGQVTAVRNGKDFKEIYITPSGFQSGFEEVLIVLEGVHQAIPDNEVPSPAYKVNPPPPDATADAGAGAASPSAGVLSTDADRLKEQYRQAGQAQKHVFGEGGAGSAPPDFTKIPGIREAPTANAQTPQTAKPTPSPTQAATGKPGSPPPNGAAAAPNSTTAPKTNTTAPAKAPAEATANVTAPKPKTRAPVLVTDPTDADPNGEPAPSSNPPERARAKEPPLDEFGTPKTEPKVQPPARPRPAAANTGAGNPAPNGNPAAPPKVKATAPQNKPSTTTAASTNSSKPASNGNSAVPPKKAGALPPANTEPQVPQQKPPVPPAQ
jgi:rod shape-determining protein MreC